MRAAVGCRDEGTVPTKGKCPDLRFGDANCEEDNGEKKI